MGTTETKKMRVGVVGCGAISDIYLTNMIHNFENLEVQHAAQAILNMRKRKQSSMASRAVPTRKFWQTRRLKW